MRISLPIVLWCYLLTSCGELFGDHQQLNDRYFIEAIDDVKNRSLYYRLNDGGGVGRINGNIKEVGLNKRHIIIKQIIGDSKVYYILDMAKDREFANPRDSLSGPYTDKEFSVSRNKMGVDKNLEFSITFD